MSSREALQRNMQDRKTQAETPGTNSKGKVRNAQDQATHDEHSEALNAQDENTERDQDHLYDTETDNEVTEWRRHTDLDAPPARPGYVQRFIRVRLGPNRDISNFNKSFREGWRPVKASSQPDNSLPTTNYGKFGDVIGVEDMILCEMPKNVYKQRQKYYGNKQRRQSKAIERQLGALSQKSGESTGFGPISHVNKTRVERASRPTQVADDD